MQGRDATATLTTPGGADVTISVSQIDVANDETQDPRLFEDDYDVASATGFRVWEASSLFVALLRQRSVQQQFAGRCVLELGSGTGFLAMAAASIGAHVLATDTRTVTVDSIRPNIERNCSAPSQALVAVAGFAVEGHRRLGAGSVAAAALDWHADARLQLSAAGVASNFTFDIILAADCIWLLDVAQPFADTLCSLMPPGCPTIAVLCFQNRAHDNSTTFVKLDQVAAALVAFACLPLHLSARIRRWSLRRSHALLLQVLQMLSNRGLHIKVNGPRKGHLPSASFIPAASALVALAAHAPQRHPSLRSRHASTAARSIRTLSLTRAHHTPPMNNKPTACPPSF
jgi:predicted nicotinamide N-methyase